MVQWAIGETERSSSVRPGPLPAPLEQERQRKEPADCASLGKHSWVEPPEPQGDEIVQDDPLQDCPWSTGGIEGLVQDLCVQTLPLSTPATVALAAPCLAGSSPSLDPWASIPT